MNERSIDDFFKKENESNKQVDVHNNDEHKKSFIKKFFRERFSFDFNVDITNKASVLYRRNCVIKNIIFLANLVFVFFSFIGISNKNYIITIVFFLLMTGLSLTIKSMLKKKKEDYQHQKIIMYTQSFFVLFLAIVLYVKVWLGYYFKNNGANFEQAELLVTQAVYVLIYLTFVIMSLYQNPKHLRVMFFWSLISITVIHLTLVHPELYQHADGLKEFLKFMFIDNKLIGIDLLLRTIVFIVLFASLYSSATISRYMTEQRYNELNRRVGVENSFAAVVENVFEAVRVYNSSTNIDEQIKNVPKITRVAKEIGNALNFSRDNLQVLSDFSKVHVDKIGILSTEKYEEVNDENIEEIMAKTHLATQIIKRLQISRRAEDVAQAVYQNRVSFDLKNSLSKMDNDKFTQVILLSEIYVILRSDRDYKSKQNHKRSVELILKGFTRYFDEDILIRFDKYTNEIEMAYEKAI